MSLLFAIPWTIGALIDPDGRERFDFYLKQLLSGKVEEFPIPKALGKIDLMFPDKDSVYDYMPEVIYI